jgi:hypothetical protein
MSIEDSTNSTIKRLFIVGAGLSKAVHEPMPLANELVETLKSHDLSAAMVTGNLETSLAYLAQEHPFDRAPELYERKALLQRAVQVIAENIAKVQAEALKSIPEWFSHLVGCWVGTNADVVSFNYDLLVEQTKERGISHCGDSPKLKLWKPHGSLDKMWIPDKHLTITSAEATPEGLVEQRLSGYEPFIVPPTTSKSSYYGANELAEPWHRFRQSLESVDEVVLLGFSAADADFTVNGLLHDTLVRRQKLSDRPVVYCVSHSEPSIDGVCKRLEKIDIKIERGRCVAGVESYVNDYFIKQMTQEVFNIQRMQHQWDATPLYGKTTSTPIPILIGKIHTFANLPTCLSTVSIDSNTLKINHQSEFINGNYNQQDFSFMSINDFFAKAANVKRIITSDGKLVVGFEIINGHGLLLITAKTVSPP